jgi:hypothetical protein
MREQAGLSPCQFSKKAFTNQIIEYWITAYKEQLSNTFKVITINPIAKIERMK